MTYAAASGGAVPVAGNVLAKLFLAIGVFLSAFVLYEPAPYEIYMAVLIGIWFLFGLRLSRNSGILLAILLCFNLGGLLSLAVVDEIDTDLTLYLAVSLFPCSVFGFLCCSHRSGRHTLAHDILGLCGGRDRDRHRRHPRLF